MRISSRAPRDGGSYENLKGAQNLYIFHSIDKIILIANIICNIILCAFSSSKLNFGGYMTIESTLFLALKTDKFAFCFYCKLLVLIGELIFFLCLFLK